MKTEKRKGGQKPVAREKLDQVGVETIAMWIAEGKSYRKIAEEVGCGLGRLYEWIELDAERSQACARAREQSAQTWDEKSVQCIEEAEDGFALMKAKELAVHYRWRAKAVNPKRYGDKQQVDMAVKASISIVSDFPDE